MKKLANIEKIKESLGLFKEQNEYTKIFYVNDGDGPDGSMSAFLNTIPVKLGLFKPKYKGSWKVTITIKQIRRELMFDELG